MINPKNICISAAVGFVLSFVVGLLFGVNFLHIIIRAVFFAALFAALFAGISYLYKNFLSDSFSSENESAQASDGNSSKPSSGGIVNIVVDDSTLKDDSTAPKFAVTDDNIFKDAALARKDSSPAPKNQYQKTWQDEIPPRPAEKADAVSSPEPEAQEKKPEQGAEFVASDLSSMTSSAARAEPKAEAAPKPADAGGEELSGGKEEQSSDEEKEAQSVDDSEDIDELPDIGGIDFSSNPSSLDSSSDSVIEDSEFATEGSPRPSAAAADTGGQNIDNMAQAIRTLLAKDKE